MNQDKEVKLSLQPDMAENFTAKTLTGFAQKMLDAGADHGMIQQLAYSSEGKVHKMAARRMVKAWKEENPLTIFRNPFKQWELIYDHCFGYCGVSFDESGLSDLKTDEIFPKELPVLVGKGLGIGALVRVCREYFKVEVSHEFLVTLKNMEHSRTSEKSYGITVKNIADASMDKRFGRKTPDDLRAMTNHTGMTILERMLLELFYYTTTGQHLDTEVGARTLCLGSFDSYHGVPTVSCLPGGVIQISSLPRDTYIADNKDFSREVSVW